jgi:hypothetical protein
MPDTRATPRSVLVIVAHADDLEFMAGGTIAHMADLGYTIREVIATNNEPDWSTQFTADAAAPKRPSTSCAKVHTRDPPPRVLPSLGRSTQGAFWQASIARWVIKHREKGKCSSLLRAESA